MSFLNYKELSKFQDSLEIEKEILTIQKEIVKLKLKKIGKTNGVTPHLFIHFKRRIKQLKTYQKSFFGKKNIN